MFIYSKIDIIQKSHSFEFEEKEIILNFYFIN